MPTRRDALFAIGGLTAAGTLGLPGLSLAAAPTDNRLVVIVLRGGMDGLGAIVPYTDPHYADLRPNIGSAKPGEAGGVLDLDGRFGLHPALDRFHQLYRSRQLAVVHAVSTPDRSRSHFDAQDTLENGTGAARGARDGWLNRAIGNLRAKEIGISVGPSTPLVMRGKHPVRSWAPSAIPAASANLMARLDGLYQGDPLFAQTFAQAKRSAGMTASAMPGRRPMRGGRKAFLQMAEAAGRFLALARGPRVASLEMGGWDTHAGQKYRLPRQLESLQDGVEEMRVRLGPAWRKTVIVAISEFGRTARENGSRGTDHGTGGAVFIVGGAVRGGKVFGRWPELAQNALYAGRDLAPTTDLRAVLKGVLSTHLGVGREALDSAVFPDSSNVTAMNGLIRKS